MVKRALDKLGAECWRFMPVQTGFGSPALDYLLAIRGRFVAIETKAPGKKLTPLQETTKAAIEAAGGIVLIVWDEGSLAIAMKIIFALEFAPRHGHETEFDHLRDCLDESRAGYEGSFRATRIVDEAQSPKIVRRHASCALDAATSGDHGAPRPQPKGRTVKAARS